LCAVVDLEGVWTAQNDGRFCEDLLPAPTEPTLSTSPAQSPSAFRRQMIAIRIMKLALFIALAMSLFFAGPVRGKSLLLEVTPSDPEVFGLTVKIDSTRLEHDSVLFHVVVTGKDWGQSATKPSTSLSVVKIIETKESRSETGKTIRALPSVQEGQSLRCVFTVQKAALRDPDLCFVLGYGVKSMIHGQWVSMPSANILYAHLKKFAP
jgi:hypothetical protein